LLPSCLQLEKLYDATHTEQTVEAENAQRIAERLFNLHPEVLHQVHDMSVFALAGGDGWNAKLKDKTVELKDQITNLLTSVKILVAPYEKICHKLKELIGPGAAAKRSRPEASSDVAKKPKSSPAGDGSDDAQEDGSEGASEGKTLKDSKQKLHREDFEKFFVEHFSAFGVGHASITRL
jgi:hypothetical protein